MVRVTKLADYGILLLTWFAHHPGEEQRSSATTLAQETAVPLPTVSKLLQALGRAGILDSQRGASGGYQLARPADQISVAEIIQALEGPIALTDCITHGVESCEVGSNCTTRTNWDRINTVILAALGSISLADMARPQHGWRERMGSSLVGHSVATRTVPLLPLAPTGNAPTASAPVGNAPSGNAPARTAKEHTS